MYSKKLIYLVKRVYLKRPAPSFDRSSALVWKDKSRENATKDFVLSCLSTPKRQYVHTSCHFKFQQNGYRSKTLNHEI